MDAAASGSDDLMVIDSDDADEESPTIATGSKRMTTMVCKSVSVNHPLKYPTDKCELD